MKKLFALLLLLAALPVAAQTGTKIVFDAPAAGQTGAIQSAADTSSVGITFCGTGYSGVLYVDAASTSASLVEVWTTTLAGNSDCTTVYTEIPALKWHRVRWTLTAGTLNVWMVMTRGGTTASYGTMAAPAGAAANDVAVFLGSPLRLSYLTAGSALQVLRVNAAGTALEFAVPAGNPFSGTTFRATQPATLTITNTTNATPIEVTAAAHGLLTGDYVVISGITGNTNANGFFRVTRTGVNTFTLQNYSTAVDIAGNGAHGGSPVAVAGIVGAEQFMASDGTAAQPGFGFATQRIGLYRIGTSQVGLSVGGTARQGWSNSGTIIGTTGVYGWGTISSNAYDTFLTRPAAATVQLGDAASATPVAQTLQAQGSRAGTDTDIGGGNLTIQPGIGTGAGTGSSLIFRIPYLVASGTGAQTPTTMLTMNYSSGIVFGTTISTQTVRPAATDSSALGSTTLLYQVAYLSRAILGSKSKAIVDATPTAFATFTIADGATYGGEIIYSVVSTQGTAKQRLDGRARFSATREGTTYTVAVNEIGTQTLAAAAGTLTGAIAIGGTAGVVTLSANFNTSQTPDTFVINPRFDSPDAGLALTFP